MKPFSGKNFKSIAMVSTMAILFFSCKDNYKRAGQEKIPLVYPIGIDEDFTAARKHIPRGEKEINGLELCGSGDQIFTLKNIAYNSGIITKVQLESLNKRVN